MGYARYIGRVGVPSLGTLRQSGFNHHRGSGRGDTSAAFLRLDGFLVWRPPLTNRCGRRYKRSQSC
jgi:hypothetical protein